MQVQDDVHSLVFNHCSARNNQKFKLNFNHPTKELIFAIKIGAFNGEANRNCFNGSGRGKFLTYTNEDWKWRNEALNYAAKNLVEGCIFVNPGLVDCSGSINNQDVHLCSKLRNPGYNAGMRITVDLRNNNVDGLYHGENILEINECGINVYCFDTYFSCLNFSLFGNGCGYELSDFIRTAHVVVSHNDGDCASICIECVCVDHELCLADLSIPIEDFAVDNRSTGSMRYKVHKDVAVVQFNNYGLMLNGEGNPVLCAWIELNGQKRFDPMDGEYFNYYQPYLHHTHTPADGINVYSFALTPEKHQPSGTTNFSRIDSTYLVIDFADRIRMCGKLKLDIARDTLLYVYAWSYNILRVLSGMGGLAYSN
jgi:hypothetical protein